MSDYPVDIISFDNILPELNIAHARIFRDKRSSIIHNWTMTVDTGYEYIQRFHGNIHDEYMMNNYDFLSNISFKTKIENGEPVSFDGQSITLRLSNNEVLLFLNDRDSN